MYIGVLLGTMVWGENCPCIFQVGESIWVYGGSSGGKRSNVLWRITHECPEEEGGALLPGETTRENGSGSDVRRGQFKVEEVNKDVMGDSQGGGRTSINPGGREHGPGDLMWHAAAAVFDRFLIVYGGRRAPPHSLARAQGSARQSAGSKSSSASADHQTKHVKVVSGVDKEDEEAGGAEGGGKGGGEGGGGEERGGKSRSMKEDVYVFDTLKQRWITFEMSAHGKSLLNFRSHCDCRCVKFQNTLVCLPVCDCEWVQVSLGVSMSRGGENNSVDSSVSKIRIRQTA